MSVFKEHFKFMNFHHCPLCLHNSKVYNSQFKATLTMLGLGRQLISTKGVYDDVDSKEVWMQITQSVSERPYVSQKFQMSN